MYLPHRERKEDKDLGNLRPYGVVTSHDPFGVQHANSSDHAALVLGAYRGFCFSRTTACPLRESHLHSQGTPSSSTCQAADRLG